MECIRPALAAGLGLFLAGVSIVAAGAVVAVEAAAPEAPAAERAAAAIAAAAKATCREVVPYRGQPPRAAPALPEASELRDAIDGTFAAATVERLRGALAKGQQATSAASMSVAVAVPGAGLWMMETGAGGAALPAAAPLHYWASAGKTFVAIVILQLVEEGKLTLADPVSRWVKDVPNGDAITVEQLLTHTSGLFSASEDKRLRASPRYYTPDEKLAIARKQGPLFCPGERWRYSNTNYDLLGLIIERVDGRPFPAAITARIITPLGLTRMRVLTPGEASLDVSPIVSREDAINPSWPGAAGGIAASADDMLRVWHALLGGRLVKADTLRRMFARPYPMFTPVEFYGLGVMVYDVPRADGSPMVWVGHSGGTPGAGAIVAYSLTDRTLVGVAMTGEGTEARAPALANLLLAAWRAPGVAR